MSIQNDRLKGEFYRTPMTKLASRSNVITQINELIEYFNGLSDLINNTFDRITIDRDRMKNILTQINNKTRHLKYIIENFAIVKIYLLKLIFSQKIFFFSLKSDIVMKRL